MTRAAPRRLISAAAEWRLIGLLLERPRAGWSEEIAALGREVRHRGLGAAAQAARAATEGGYLSLLGPGGGVSPREVSYRSFADPGRVLADLAMIYDAFAFQPRAEDPPDHLAVEAGFVGYLLLKEAFALTRGDSEAAAVTAAARARVLEQHLTAARPFAERLVAAGGGYLASAAAILAHRVPEHHAPIVPFDGDAEWACGACAEE